MSGFSHALANVLYCRKAGSSSGQYSNYTLLNTPLEQVLMQIEDDPSLKWPEKMKGDPSKRNKSKTVIFTKIMGMTLTSAIILNSKLRFLLSKES